MNDLKSQVGGALLVILTGTLVVCAVLNFQQHELFRLPEDGVTWMDHLDPAAPDKSISVIAMQVQPGGPGEKAGIRLGDELIRIGGLLNRPGIPIRQATDVAQMLQRYGAWGRAEYVLVRNGVEITAEVIISDSSQDQALLYQYVVGAAYLLIGLFLFFRRNRAAHALHFYLLCLASFVSHTFHYTGKMNDFDEAIYIGNFVAGLMAAALFLHFCLTFPEPRPKWTRWKAFSIYLPALSLIALQLGITSGLVRTALPGIELKWLLDRVWLLVYCASYLAGAVLLHLSYRRRNDDPIVRQQLKWLRNGTLAGMVPFIAVYAVPYVAGIIPTPEMNLAVLFLALIPLTWAYAILRYRLMDVDIIFQQGYVYLLATIAVLGVVSILVFALAQREGLSPTAVILLVIVAAFVFEPLRGWIQQNFDRYVFYKDRWDYRRTLIGFARELSAEMDLDRMLASVGVRLIETLSVRQVAFFLDNETQPGRFQPHSLYTRDGRRALPEEQLDLSFLEAEPSRPYLFFERTRHAFDVVTSEMPASVRATIARLDLTYYVPCAYRGRTLAWLGLSRTEEGDFLSSDDIDLLSTLSGYVGMAVENARLYRSLADKALQYERLKEFSENIVESINVGVLAAGLDDRVESWNSQMERLTGILRGEALGRALGELFPPELASHFEALQGSHEVHQLYKMPLRPAGAAWIAGLDAAASIQNGENGTHGAADEARAEAVLGSANDARREVTVNVAIAPLVSREGSRIGRLVILDDITEREELERKLVQADKLSSIGLLAAGVAHEVNTPLAVISTYAQMLAKQVAGDEQKSKLLDKIARQTFRASEIVNSLLNFSRTSSTAFEELDLNRLIRETLTLLEHQFQKAGIVVQTDMSDSIPPIRGNQGKLQQVFLNLFINARDAMDSGGKLKIATRPDDQSVCVEVRDSGAGIARENLARVFDPFFTTKASRKGTGLGLSVSYGIVEEHGGGIEVESEPGEGTVFRLDFPAVRKAVNA
ncbi:MAG: ATP-binding protein [Bryobacteraceae bacterium]